MKPSRNQPCPCGSGTKYKFCCISKELRQRIVSIEPSSPLFGAIESVDFTADAMNHISGMDRALQQFCKENDSYFFGSILTVSQVLLFADRLKRADLTMADLVKAYEASAKKKNVLSWLEDACESFSSFANRRRILTDATEAHYRGSYTLSIPSLLSQIEGILRDIGHINQRDTIKPTIKRDWDSRTLFALTDNAQFFNAFLHKLYEGGQTNATFNRNPILHGTDVSYDTHENSLILILTLLEIRNFLWFEKNTKPMI